MYSPKISEDLIHRLHILARKQGIAMTVLVDRLLKEALDKEEPKFEHVVFEEKVIPFTQKDRQQQ